MTERKKFELQEQRVDIFMESDWTCEVCRGDLRRYGTPQLAHRIAQTKRNLRVYGEKVVHHRMNLAPVCGLECNDYCNVGFQTAVARELAEKIKEAIAAENG